MVNGCLHVAVDAEDLGAPTALEQASAQRMLRHEADDQHAVLRLRQRAREVVQDAPTLAHAGAGDDDAWFGVRLKPPRICDLRHVFQAGWREWIVSLEDPLPNIGG